MRIRINNITIDELKLVSDKIIEKFLGGTQPLVVGLIGDLGTGKTTFTKVLAESLGVEQNVISPTFIIHREYLIGDYSSAFGGDKGNDNDSDSHSIGDNNRDIAYNGKNSTNVNSNNDTNDAQNSTKKYLHHIDLYRLESEKEVDEILNERLFDAKNIILIEWYDKFESYLDKKFSEMGVDLVKVYFEHDAGNTRNIEIVEVK